MFSLKKIFLCVLLLQSVILCAQTPAHETLLTHANRQFDTRNYAKAVSLYNEALTAGQMTENQRRQTKANLGYAYLQLGDNAKAEAAYNDLLLEGPLKGTMITHYLNYAKVLANNGKSPQSQLMYERHQAALAEEQKGEANGTLQTTKKLSYRIENLVINTAEAEFSPAIYRNGLVYLGGKTSVSDESVQKGFLDIMYIPNHVDIKAQGAAAAATKTSASKAPKPVMILGGDSYTRQTSNDTRTLGTYKNYMLEETAPSGVMAGSSAKSGKAGSFSKVLNTRYHEGPVTFSKDGTKIIFTRNNFNEGKKGQSNENDIKLKLYSATLNNDEWTNIAELPFNSDEYSTAHPALSRDGQLLYFVSDMPGTIGGKDLYVSRWEGTQWSAPTNMGREINTKSDEVFPFADDNGNLYFSTSGRRNGQGGLDIYYAILSSDGTKIIDILPLDAPLNSKEDDFGITTDAGRSYGYLSSSRDGNDNIYRFVRESSLYDCRDLTVRVFGEASMMHIDSAVVSVSARGSKDVAKELITDEYGRVHLCLASDNDFVFRVTKNGHLTSTVGFSTRGLTDDKPTRLEVTLANPIMIIDTIEVVRKNPNLQESSEPVITEVVDKPTPVITNTPTKNSKTKKGTTANTDTWATTGPVTMQIKGTAKDPSGEPIEGVKVSLQNLKTGKIVKQVMSDANGAYTFMYADSGPYEVVLSKEKYGTSVMRIKKPTAKSTNTVVTANLTMFKEGDIVKLNNFNYTQSQIAPRAESLREIDRLVTTMQKFSSLKIEILSHTDSRGDKEQNRILSQKRAQAIADYMTKKGIAKTRIKPVGMGEAQPLNQCIDGVTCTDSEYQRNRRTEYKILSVM